MIDRLKTAERLKKNRMSADLKKYQYDDMFLAFKIVSKGLNECNIFNFIN